jgi:hypothetical protein
VQEGWLKSANVRLLEKAAPHRQRDGSTPPQPATRITPFRNMTSKLLTDLFFKQQDTAMVALQDSVDTCGERLNVRPWSVDGKTEERRWK